jgi:hypothetical protein
MIKIAHNVALKNATYVHSVLPGFRCQVSGDKVRVNDTVNSTLFADNFFVFILNCTPHTLRVTG